MAIYHMAVKTVSRSSGRSAPSAAAYRAGALIVDARTGVTHDFTRKSGVVSTDIVLPRDAPAWAADRSALWNAAEAHENRKNSVVAREFEVALPHELSGEDRRRLALRFAREIVSHHQCGVEVSIHDPSRGGDGRNVHAHVLLTTRRLERGGFGAKTRELDDRKSGAIKRWRKRWGTLQNEALARAGMDARVDHRSLKDQQTAAFEAGDLESALKLEREPQRHVGVHANAMDRRLGQVVSERGRARQRAIMGERRAAYAAPKRAAVAIDIQLGAAAEEVAAEDRAHMRPVWAESSPAGALQVQDGDSSNPTWVAESPGRVGEGPAIPDDRAPQRPIDREVTMDSEKRRTAHEVALDESGRELASYLVQNLRSAADVRSEISRRSRDFASRLNDIPELATLRSRVGELAVAHRGAMRDLDSAKAGMASARKAFERWKNAHPLMAFMRMGKDRREALANIHGWQQSVDEALGRRDDAYAAGRPLEKRLAELIEEHRPWLEGQVRNDAAELPTLRAALEFLEKREAQLAPHEGLREVPQVEDQDAPSTPAAMVAVDPVRVAAFVSGRVGASPGPGFAMQAAFDAKAGVARSPFSRGKAVRELAAEEWGEVGIDGSARAFRAGNSAGDVRDALGQCWPGRADSIDELVRQGQAQGVVERVREALEEGREPLTEGGRVLAALVQDAPSQAEARQAILSVLAAAQQAMAFDPAFHDQNDRLAPQL